MSDSIYLYQSVPMSLSSQSVTSSSTHTHTHTHTHSFLTFPSSSLTFHNISSVPSTALHNQHFLKLLTVTSGGEMCCHAVMIHAD